MVYQTEKFQGNRLRVARTFHGLTLEDIGTTLGVTKQYVQKLESDDKCSPPTDEFLIALSKCLKVDVGFFFARSDNELTEDNCYFRKLKSTSSNIKKRALAYGTFFEQIVSYLDERVELPKIRLPKVSDKITLDDIELLSRDCRIEWGVGTDAPIENVTRTLENAGFIVVTFGGVSEKIDAFSFYGKRPIVVQNTDKGNICRSRFDKSHEAGHSVMHRFRKATDPQLEIEANAFASAFLMPKAPFLEEFPKAKKFDWYKIIQMKKRWKVNLEAIIYRAFSLELISYSDYQSAFKQINRFVKNMNLAWTEPTPEPPEVVDKSFEILCSHFRCTTADIAKSMGMSVEMFRPFEIPLITKPASILFVDFKARRIIDNSDRAGS